MIRTLLWDADSALFDTLPTMTYAMSRVLREMGMSLPLNRINVLLRQSPESCVDALSRRFKLAPHLLMEQYATIYGTVSPANRPPFAGMPELTAWIVAQGGVNIALTQGDLKTVVEQLKAHRLDTFFENVLSLDAIAHFDNLIFITAQEDLLLWARDHGFQTAYFGEKSHPIAELSFDAYHKFLQVLQSQKGAQNDC